MTLVAPTAGVPSTIMPTFAIMQTFKGVVGTVELTDAIAYHQALALFDNLMQWACFADLPQTPDTASKLLALANNLAHLSSDNRHAFGLPEDEVRYDDFLNDWSQTDVCEDYSTAEDALSVLARTILNYFYYNRGYNDFTLNGLYQELERCQLTNELEVLKSLEPFLTAFYAK